MLLRRLLLLIFILVSVACGSDYPLMFSIENAEAQKELVGAVRESGIDVRVDAKGHLWYSIKDREIIETIANRVMSQSEHITRITFRYPDSKYTIKLIEELKAANIPYETVQIDGQLNIQLTDEYRKELEELKQSIDVQFYSEAREQLNHNEL